MSDFNSKKSVAFCISGQIRSYEALKKINQEINKLRNSFNVKVFITTWEKKGLQDSIFNRNNGKLGRIFEGNLVPYLPDSWLKKNKIWDYLPKNKKKIDDKFSMHITKEKILECIDADVIDIEQEKMDLNFNERHKRFNKDKSSIKMYYKAWRCNEIKKQFECKNDSFDFVIGCRPDRIIVFKSQFIDIELKDKELEDKELFHIQTEYEAHLDDTFRLSNSKTSDIVSSIFSKTIQYPNDWQGTHRELFLYCKNLNFKLYPINNFIKSPKFIVDENDLITYDDLLLDYPELKNAFINSKEINNLSIPLQSIAKGFHERTKKNSFQE